ncbi:hypothetical protein [Helicobacter colisuis]|uniref:hypothetical protein n=1 Tax=Helicobacter colisuis TaxID=2949739 RepID=UPI00202A6837|nr:hypothetical protein [Helicobacter colisuis]MCL9822757.1 hypothetical protein [Helicobacter colisuis]
MEIQTQEILNRLKEAKTKENINECMLLIRAFGQEWQKQLEDSYREEIIALLKEKILEIIVSKGDILDKSILWAYGLFEGRKSSKKDERFMKYFDFCSPYVEDSNASYYERLLFIEFASAALLLSGDKEGAVKFFFSKVIYLSLRENYMVELDPFTREFLYYYEIPVEWILEIQREALKWDNFSKLDDFTKKTIFLWNMHCFWNVKHYFNHLKWRENFPVWLDCLKGLLEQGNLDMAMYVEFYIYHKFGNSAQTQEDWQEYNDKVVKLVEPYYVEYGKNLPKCKASIGDKSEKKIKIALIKDRIVENSPYKVEYSLCKALMQNEEFAKQYELVVYSMNYIQKSEDGIEAMQSFVQAGVPVVCPAYQLIRQYSYYYSHLQKALSIRQSLLSEGVDIIIITGTIDCADFLLATRSAPKQIYWSHGNGRYDIVGIDERISHAIPPTTPYDFKSFSVPMDIERFYNPPRDPKLIEAEKAQYPITKDTVVLGVIGRLVKVDSDEYLECIAEVMKKHPNTIFIAAGSGNMPVIRNKVEKLGISERFFMPGFVDPHIYGHIIDIFCDTFPLGQGESIAEFYSKEGLTISFRSNEFSLKDKALKELKFSDRMIVYITNLWEFNSSIFGYKKFIEGKPLFIYNKKDVLLTNEILENGMFVDLPDKKMRILAEYTCEIRDGKVFYIHIYDSWVRPKKEFDFIYYAEPLYSDYGEEYLKSVKPFERDGWEATWWFAGYGVKNYKDNLSAMIADEGLRLELCEYKKVGLSFTHKKQYKDFMQFANVFFASLN